MLGMKPHERFRGDLPYLKAPGVFLFSPFFH